MEFIIIQMYIIIHVFIDVNNLTLRVICSYNLTNIENFYPAAINNVRFYNVNFT